LGCLTAAIGRGAQMMSYPAILRRLRTFSAQSGAVGFSDDGNGLLSLLLFSGAKRARRDTKSLMITLADH
jgi:hypothetical protein